MTDYDNKDLNGQEPMNDQSPETAAPETPIPEAPVPEAPKAEAPAPYTTPDPSSTPHLTLEPDPQPPVEPVPEEPAPVEDPFQTPEPPRAPEPPAYQQAAPNYTQPPQYAPPQYAPPQYGAPQYQPQQPNYAPVYNVPPAGYVQKSRLAAGLLALLFGTFGVHNYYLGFNTRATVQLIVSLAGGLLTCGVATAAVAIWGFVEGILILSASPSRLYDGNNVILRD